MKLEETCELRLINHVQGHMTYFHVIWRLVCVSYYNYILQHAEKKKILTAYPRKRMMIFRSDYKSNKFVSSSKTTAICFPDKIVPFWALIPWITARFKNWRISRGIITRCLGCSQRGNICSREALKPNGRKVKMEKKKVKFRD